MKVASKLRHDMKDLSQDWTKFQEDRTRHKARKLHKGLSKTKWAYADLHKTKFFKGQSQNQETNTANVYCRQWCSGKGLHPGAHVYVKLVEDPPSVLSPGRLCDELEYSYHWQPGGKTDTNKTQENYHVLHRQFPSSCRGHSAEAYTINQVGNDVYTAGTFSLAV